jgi:hypothetical protein
LNVSQWTARKYDRKVSKEVAEKYGASDEMGRYNKVLIAQDEIKKISKIVNQARTAHYDNSLPWGDNGDRILPAANYERYTERLEALRAEFWEAVSYFEALYPALKEDARASLNGLYNEQDYPPATTIRRKYGFTLAFSPLPVADDFRVSVIGDQAAEKIRQQIEARTLEAQRNAMAELWQRLFDAVKHMAEKLADPDAIFRDSLVNNLVELTEVLPALNFTQDPALAELAKEATEKLTNLDPQTLRDSLMFRKTVAGDAGNLLAKITGAGARFIDLS